MKVDGKSGRNLEIEEHEMEVKRSNLSPTLSKDECKQVKKRLNVPFGTYADVEAVAADFPAMSIAGVLSLYNTLRVDRVKKNFGSVSNLLASRAYADDLLKPSGRGILELSREVDMAPCSTFRLLLSQHFQSIGNKPITAWIRQPWCIPPPIRQELHAYPDGTTQKLCKDAERCFAWDDTQSPAAEMMRHGAGASAENRLGEKLHALGVPFRSESDLKSQQQVKTPDVLLYVPIAVGSQPVHWIDSKSSFGDSLALKDAMQQLLGYVNRFGPGMVIFWHGFAEGLEQHEGILVASGFPEDDEVELLHSLHQDSDTRMAAIQEGNHVTTGFDATYAIG